MKRKLNYTGREKIKRENVSIHLSRQNDTLVAFEITRLDLGEMNLPPDAIVYVEAYYRTELKRFELGTVSTIRCPFSCDLKGMAYTQNLKFRILVVEPSGERKILAHADRIAPEEPAERKSILPVEFCDLGYEIWRVSYEGEEGSPILLINSRIPNIQNIAKQDPHFMMFVYPAVMREILTHMVFVDGVDSCEWHDDWLGFVSLFRVPRPATLNKEDSNFEEENALKWINECVTTFCNTYSVKFQEYIQKLGESP